MTNTQKPYKYEKTNNISNLRIVSMIPGDLMVAGCLNFYKLPSEYF